jgi:hypothetical protein
MISIFGFILIIYIYIHKWLYAYKCKNIVFQYIYMWFYAWCILWYIWMIFNWLCKKCTNDIFIYAQKHDICIHIYIRCVYMNIYDSCFLNITFLFKFIKYHFLYIYISYTWYMLCLRNSFKCLINTDNIWDI